MRRFITVAVALVALGLPAAALGVTTAPVLTSTLSNSTDLSGLVSVAVSGQDAYTTAYWPGQLVAVNLSNLGTPTSPGTLAIDGQTAATTSLENGSNVTIAGTGANATAYVVSKNRNASTSSNDDGSGNSLTEVNVSNPAASPLPISGTVHDAPGPSSRLFGSYGVAIQGQFAYVASQGVLPGQPTTPDTSTGEFSVVDLATNTIVKTLDNTSPAGSGPFDHPTSVAISPNGAYAYVTSFADKRVTVVNILVPTNPTIVTSVTSPAADLANPVDLAVQGHYLYLANQDDVSNQFTIMDISNPAAPVVVGTLNNSALQGAYRIRVRGDFAYVSASDAFGIAAIDITDPTNPRVAGSLIDNTHLHKTTGLDLDSSGKYVIATSPYLSSQSNVIYPPFPGSSGVVDTGTISAIQLDPNPIAVSISTPTEPPNPTTQTTASFTFSSNDDVSAFQCQLDSAPMGLCSTASTANYSSLSNGSHTFTVQATDSAGRTSSQSYSWTVGPPSTAPVNTSPPTISGAALQGHTLTASSGTWSGNPAPTFGYQWYQCDQNGQGCTQIQNAGSPSYTPQPNDVGHTLEVIVTAINSSGSPTAQSKPTAVVQVPTAPANSSLPTISGSAVSGKTLTTSTGTWSGVPAPTFGYQWLQCNSSGQSCASISSATGSSYTVRTGDVGKTLAVVVAGSNGVGSPVLAQSKPTGVVQGVTAPPKNTALPKVSGTDQPGNRLSGSNGTWSGSPAPTFTYKWERCNAQGAACKVLSGQTKSTYTVVAADVGSRLRLMVTAKNASGSATAVSGATAAISSATAQTANWRAVLVAASTHKPTLQITIPGGHGKALVTTLTVSLPKGITFSGGKSKLVKDVTIKTTRGKRLAFTAALKRGALVLTLKRPTAGVEAQVSSRALSVSKAFLTGSKHRPASASQVTVTVRETPRGVMLGRLKLRLG